MKGCLLELDKGFKSYEHLKTKKNAKNWNKLYGRFTAKAT